jgi:hypothetical protein
MAVISASDAIYYSKRGARWLIVLLIAYVTFKVVPVYGRALRFEYNLDNAIRFAATVKASTTEIVEDILWQAEHLNLPIERQNVKVQIYPQERLVMARVSYQVPVELGPQQVVLDFHANSRERALMTASDVETLREVLEPFQQGPSP